ncbi:MAG: OmpA family protein [Gammaproteobacteria bacterium]
MSPSRRRLQLVSATQKAAVPHDDPLRDIAFTDSSQSHTQTSDDEIWMISYMDIMTLLLTLFVLLFAYTKLRPEPVTNNQHDRITTHSLSPPAAPSPPFFTSLPASGHTWPRLGVVGVSVAQRVDTVHEVNTPSPSMSAPQVVYKTSLEDPIQVENAQDDIQKQTRPSTLADAALAVQPPDAAASVREDFLKTIHASPLGERIEVTTQQDSINLEISDNILFEPGSAALKPLGQQVLNDLSTLLVNQSYQVSVEGHTDNVRIETPRFASNWELSTTRATTVTRYLILRGIIASRLRAVGYADTHPRADNVTAEDRARNRRVSLILSLPLTQKTADSTHGQ